MKQEVAPEVWRIPVMPRAMINCYVIEDVLIDAGVRGSAAKIRAAIDGMDITAHALTHAHPDHQGSSAQICTERQIPLWCGAGDTAVVESGDMRAQFRNPDGWLARLQHRLNSGPGHPVERVLAEGDRIGEFVVLETPGHTAGHIAFWRARDRVLVLGDVALALNPFTGMAGLRLPPGLATPDPERNKASLRKLAVLGPEIVCFGHGMPLTDAEEFQRFVARVAGSDA